MATKNLRSRTSIELLAEGYLDEEAVLDEAAVESSLFYVDQDTGILYVRVPGVDGAEDTWVSQGSLVSTYADPPEDVGTAAAGTSGELASRGDHVHGHGDQGTLASAHDAEGIDVVDAAGHFDATNVETALAEAYDDFELHLSEVAPYWEAWHNINMAGRLYGGCITDNGDGTVAIEAGGGMKKADEAGPEGCITGVNEGQGSLLTRVTWAAVPSLALTDDAYNYIYYDGTDGIIKATTNFYSVSFTQDFTLGRAWRDGTTITVRLCGTNMWNFNRRVQLFGEEVFPVVKATGLVPSEVGARYLSVTAGVLWAELVNRFSIDAIDTSVASTYIAWYRDGVGGWTQVPAQTQVDNTQYDDGSGTLATLSNSRYGVHWVYVVHDGSLHTVYGQGNYLLAAATEAAPPATLPGLLASYASLVAKVIVQKSATNLYSVEQPQSTSFTVTSVTSHADLAGIMEDDHHGHPLDNLVAITDPTSTDDSSAGYEVLSRWVNTATNTIWVCASAAASAAVWNTAGPGADGADGATWYDGAGTPSTGVGSADDYYLESS